MQSKSPVIFSLFELPLAKTIQEKLHAELGYLEQHQFPDGETVIRINTDISRRVAIVVDSLNQPNEKLLPLLLAAETARSLGAARVILVAPYLAYMRQDKIFEPGQGVTSAYFAKLISHYFDALITIDPHLHRWHALNDIYTIPTNVLHAIDNIATWIQQNVNNPVLIGPDSESVQWVKSIAEKAHVPYLILEKNRKGDASIEVSVPRIETHRHATPILVDDIISTGMTMLETVKHLHTLQMKPPICIGIHAVFSENSYQRLLDSGVEKIVTCNTIAHISNGIDISDVVVNCLLFNPSIYCK